MWLDWYSYKPFIRKKNQQKVYKPTAGQNGL